MERDAGHWIAASARLLRDSLTPRNRTQLAVVVSDDGLVNATPQVTVNFGGATRRAVWLIPNAITVGKSVYVERLDARLDASLAVIAPAFQVAWAYSGGVGAGPLGDAPLGA